MPLLFLQAVHLLPGPGGWLAALDRTGYLIGLIAALQWLVVTAALRIVGRRGRSADRDPA